MKYLVQKFLKYHPKIQIQYSQSSLEFYKKMLTNALLNFTCSKKKTVTPEANHDFMGYMLVDICSLIRVKGKG